MISDKYINSLEPPLCPVCKTPMKPDHTQKMVGENPVYTEIRFTCYASSTAEYGDHRLMLGALTPELWEGTVKHWNLRPAPDPADDSTMAILGEH